MIRGFDACDISVSSAGEHLSFSRAAPVNRHKYHYPLPNKLKKSRLNFRNTFKKDRELYIIINSTIAPIGAKNQFMVLHG
jgi:hypothetical protein